MPYCRECASEIQEDWKFCPQCNSSQQTASVSVQDGVIAGDVTIGDNITNITNQEIECPQCNTAGAIIIHQCQGNISSTCLEKVCESCLDDNSFCGPCIQEEEHNIIQESELKVRNKIQNTEVWIRNYEEKFFQYNFHKYGILSYLPLIILASLPDRGWIYEIFVLELLIFLIVCSTLLVSMVWSYGWLIYIFVLLKRDYLSWQLELGKQ